VRQRQDRLVGFTYDEAAGVAHFSMYVPGTAGRVRKRATVRAASYEQAVGLWSTFRSRAAEGLRRPSPEAPTFCEFITDYFPSIEANVKEKTAIDYRYSIDRHLIPQLGALRLTEITSGVLNRLGASLKAAGYAGATVNKYMTLAALLLGYEVEFDVIPELPLKKKLKKQKANKPCLELNSEERAAFLAAFNDEPGFAAISPRRCPKGNSGRSRMAASDRDGTRDIFIITIAALMRHRIVLHANCGDYGGFWRAQPRWLRRLIRLALRQAETMILPSGLLACMFDFEPLLETRIVVVPNAAPTAEPRATQRIPPDDEIRLVYLSNFIAAKGYQETIRAVAILRTDFGLPVTCRLVGEFLVDGGAAAGRRTRARAQANLQRMIDDEQLAEYVTILPAAGPKRKNQILRDSHFLLLPTRYTIEAQPLAVIEAMAAGCIPIAPEYRGIPDLIVNGRTGVMAGPDPADMARAIADLYAHPERYSTMSRAAIASSRAFYGGGPPHADVATSAGGLELTA
jgi:glycosyltransferase involved in cell wall biosynthesis